MAAKKKKITQAKVKKKKWFTVLAPKLFNNASLGESYVADSELLQGKYVTANLSTIVGNMRKQNINMHFRVISVADGKAQTEVIGYSLINAALKRLVRRGRDKIGDSFLAKTKDKKVLRIKPLIITRSKGTKSTQSAVRLETRRVIREFVFSKTVEEFFAEIADAKLQKLVKQECAKIFPLRSMDIKSARLEENAGVVITEDGVKTEKVTIRRKDKGELHSSVQDVPKQAEDDDQDVDAEDIATDEDSADADKKQPSATTVSANDELEADEQEADESEVEEREADESEVDDSEADEDDSSKEKKE